MCWFTTLFNSFKIYLAQKMEIINFKIKHLHLNNLCNNSGIYFCSRYIFKLNFTDSLKRGVEKTYNLLH